MSIYRDDNMILLILEKKPEHFLAKFEDFFF